MPHARRLVALPPPQQHAVVELLRGTMTKHNFIVYRDDCLIQTQPIAFDGERWRGYIPLRLPWTLRIRERAPRGYVAVLVNPTHTYPDLALPIDAEEATIFDPIDGNCTIAEILKGTLGASVDDSARRFIERLWEYDLIVFDATNLS